ncbi:hypothetical protein PAL_GLEAN10011734 [Pteropus alecto]|uniref:Uncharacterized protein n=1 Tax=Pteropus alecto TaxID=9402 RepID=L5KGW8_PTEAL|nr:hypothetical protein PAL_GLEAN10011734 [Pteropus alecto]
MDTLADGRLAPQSLKNRARSHVEERNPDHKRDYALKVPSLSSAGADEAARPAPLPASRFSRRFVTIGQRGPAQQAQRN